MAKGTTIPIQPFEVQHALTNVTVPCLVHPHHTIDTRNRTTGPHHSTQYLIHTRIGRVPLRAQTLTHHLLQERQLGAAGAVVVGRVLSRIIAVPQADESLASARIHYGLGQLLMHPVKRAQCPLITQHSPHLAPLRPSKPPDGVVQLPLCPRTVVERSLRPKHRQSGPNLLGDGFGLDRRIKEPLGLPPLMVQDALELVLSMQDVETHRERARGGFLVCLVLRFARRLGSLHAPLQPLPRIRYDTLHPGPMR